MDECGHTKLQLMSGGYYLGCVDCGKKWVAITNDGDDRNLDHKARFGASIQPYFDYVLTPTDQGRDRTMPDNERFFYQAHECDGFRAKVTIEWSWPADQTPPQEWLNRAEEIAEEAFAPAGPKAYDISLALRGQARGSR